MQQQMAELKALHLEIEQRLRLFRAGRLRTLDGLQDTTADTIALIEDWLERLNNAVRSLRDAPGDQGG